MDYPPLRMPRWASIVSDGSQFDPAFPDAQQSRSSPVAPPYPHRFSDVPNVQTILGSVPPGLEEISESERMQNVRLASGGGVTAPNRNSSRAERSPWVSGPSSQQHLVDMNNKNSSRDSSKQKVAPTLLVNTVSTESVHNNTTKTEFTTAQVDRTHVSTEKQLLERIYSKSVLLAARMMLLGSWSHDQKSVPSAGQTDHKLSVSCVFSGDRKIQRKDIKENQVANWRPYLADSQIPIQQPAMPRYDDAHYQPQVIDDFGDHAAVKAGPERVVTALPEGANEAIENRRLWVVVLALMHNGFNANVDLVLKRYAEMFSRRRGGKWSATLERKLRRCPGMLLVGEGPCATIQVNKELMASYQPPLLDYTKMPIKCYSSDLLHCVTLSAAATCCRMAGVFGLGENIMEMQTTKYWLPKDYRLAECCNIIHVCVVKKYLGYDQNGHLVPYNISVSAIQDTLASA